MENRPTGLVSFYGPTFAGGTLTATNSLADADGLGVFNYQWLANGTPLDGSTQNTLLLDKSLAGAKISLEISYTDLAGNHEKINSTQNYLETSYELSQPLLWVSSKKITFNGQPYIKDNPLLVMQSVQIDLNGDGKEDIFTYDSYPLDVPTPNPPPSIFINNGTSFEKTAWTGPLMADPHGVKILVGDFNGDGHPDIFSLTATDPPNGQFPNLQDITSIIYTGPQIQLQEFNQFKGFWYAGASGDINNNGSLDIIMFNFHVGANGVQNQILWNDGKGNFRFDPSGIGNLQVDQAELFDVNHDGYLDLVIDRLDAQGRHVSVLWGNGSDYTLDRSASFELSLSFFPTNLSFLTLNGSKNSDIVVSGVDEKGIYWVRIFGSNDGGKTFTNVSSQTIDDNSTTTRFDHIKVEDLDGNGLLDIFSPDMADNIRWEWNGSKFVRIYDAPPTTTGIMQMAANNAVSTSSITIAGTSDNDLLKGSNSVFWGGPGNDTIIGLSGINTSAYSGPLNDYTITRNLDLIVVSDTLPARDGTDTLSTIQHIQFTDYSINTTMKAEAAKLPTATVNSIIELYVAYFARTPDATGLSYWIDKAAAGETLTAISKEFYNAGVQFSSLTGYSATMANSDFIKIVYTNVLGRSGATAPPDADVAYWDNQIKIGATTKEGLIQTMLTAAHSFANDPTWGWVPKLLDNKISVGYQAAVTYGLDYNSSSDAITQGMAIAHAVTPTDTSAAVGLIGVGANIHL